MTNEQRKDTPANDSRQALIYGICDRLYDHGHCVTDVVLVPATAEGAPDWDVADPANVQALPADEWPVDERDAARCAVLVDHIDGCDQNTSMLIFLRADQQPSMIQLAGPGADADIAMRIIGRDIGAKPPERPMSPLSESVAKLTQSFCDFPPEAAPLAGVVAANDNNAPADLAARLERLQRQHGGTIEGGVLNGATIDGKTGRIMIAASGVAALHSAKGSFEVLETKPMRATPFVLRDATELPQREWLYGNHFIRRYLTATVGAGGAGKSSHAVSEVLAMVTGRPLLDSDGGLHKPLRVWYVNAEDPADEIDRRLHAAAKHFNIDAAAIGDRLFTDSGRDQEFVVMKQEGRDLKVCQPVIDDIVAEIKARQIDVLVVDPFVSTHEAQENDNGAMQRVAAAWTQVADKANCCVEVVHHVVKNAGEVTADSARGGGALKDKTRSMRVLNPMTPSEAAKVGLDSPAGYFRVDMGKVNLVTSGRSQWRRLVSVPLGNGRGMVKTGDEIGVAAPWSWPSADELALRASEARTAIVADVPADVLAGLKVRLRHGDYKAHPQGKPWAGDVVMELTDVTDKAEAKAMLDAWIAAGELEVVDILDAYRKPKPHVKPVAAP